MLQWHTNLYTRTFMDLNGSDLTGSQRVLARAGVGIGDLSASGGNYETVTLQEAIDRRLMSDADVSEVENAITFFIVYSAIQRRKDLAETLDGLAELWGARTSSLNSTEYAASLRTSTPAASTGAAKPSSIPS